MVQAPADVLTRAQDNRALSADEIASIAIDQAWLRPPSAAVGPPTIVNNAIRAHLKRCATTVPPREPLVKKHLLAGSLNEAALESALHPDAFNGLARPKGTVWYLAPSGRQKWKNPFDGLDVPTPPPRKPLVKSKKDLERKMKPAKELKVGRPKEGSEEKSVGKANAKMPAGSTPSVKLRLFLNGPSATDDDAGSEAGSSSQSGSKNPSRRPSIAAGSRTASIPPAIRRGSRSIKLGDSSDDSDSSDSEMEIDSRRGPSPLASLARGRSTKTRKERPSPLALNQSHENGHRHPAKLSRSIGSPIVDWTSGAMPSPPYPSTYPPPPLSSPFPTHSLDNTTWTVRRDADRFAALETSSSSSEDEMLDPGQWGSSSSILIQGTSEDVESELGGKGVWTAEDEEAKVKEATDALRVLFPISGAQDEDVDIRPAVRYNQLDNRPRPAPSDTSSLAESTSTATATARGPLKSADYAASVALAAYIPNSSPALSPNLKSQSFFPSVGDSSPSQHLSKLHNSFEPADMDIDEEPWLDECGQLPVQADDSLSDIDLGSVIGDTPTPEQDRQSTTAAWAREAASASFRVKEEPEDDYPSPITTEDADDASAYRASRASSSDSRTPSSRASELPPFEMDPDVSRLSDMEEILMGPESISLEELDGWIMPCMGSRVDKTPQKSKGKWRHQHQRGKTEGARCSGDWGSIGVGLSSSLLLNSTRSTPLHRVRSTKISRRRQSSPSPPRTGAESLPTPPDDDAPAPVADNAMDIDKDESELYGIGPAELEAAQAEAEAKEEEHRKAVQARAEQHKALLEAYRLKVKEESRSGAISPEAEPLSPWTDLNVAWGSSSTESINLHTPTPSAVPPAFLHSAFPTSPEGIMPTAMDPKDLVSPPLGATTPMLDEVLSQAEVEAAMNKDVPMASGDGDTKMGIVDLPTTLPKDVASVSATTTAPTPAPAPAAPVPKKTKAKAEPKELKEPKEIKPKETKSTSTTTTSTPTEKDKPVVSRPASTQPRSITKPLCPGVDACVVDNIPVYSHSYANKKTGKSFVLLRRLDTDFGKSCECLEQRE